MKNFRLLLTVAVLANLFSACQETAKEENSETTNAEQTAQRSENQKEQEPAEAKPVAVLNANFATEDDLKEIGISTELIAQILNQRPFLTMNALDSIVGADENKEELYKKLFVPFNLNTTAEADFKMIPGVGDRMAHEFEEYRPYTSIKQFRKEIGKYVDEAEVARYENYVFVPVELNTASLEDIKALPGVGDRLAAEFVEYRPYSSMEQFRKEIGKYVEVKELKRLERFVYLKK